MNRFELTTADLQTLTDRGITGEQARRQLGILRDRPRPSPVVRPCTLGDGIRELKDGEHAALLELWRRAAATGRIRKFVPASGAATRMFADLLLETADAARIFFDRRDELAFAAALRDASPRGREQDVGAVVRALVDPEGLGYGAMPKALIPFHAYPEGPRTAFAEQLVEAASYAATGRGGVARVHFTVTPDHRELFESVGQEIMDRA